MTQYFGILDGADGVWGVRIPDLPGCFGGGATAGEALSDAVSAAREWAEHRASKGYALPPASSLEGIAGSVQPHEAIVTVPVLLDSGRSVRANLSLDAALLEDIDRAAKARGLTRSAFIASAARDKILASPRLE
jgi:predicted RNase H-like HicB family nuclease